MNGLYDTLGVDRNATPEQIKKAYRKKAKAHHPDAHGGEEDEQFKKISAAYAVLNDPDKRRHYDETGEEDGGENWRVTIETILANIVVELVAAGVDDILGMAKSSVAQGREQCVSAVKSTETKKNKMLKGRERLFRKDGTLEGDFLLNAIDEKIGEFDRDIASLKRQIAIADGMKEHLRLYGCKPKPQSYNVYPTTDFMSDLEIALGHLGKHKKHG